MRILMALVLCGVGTLAHADEAFEFHHLTCDQKTRTIKIEPVRFWDIGPKIWDQTWEQHIALVKKLEKEHSLYVFDEEYGYFDDSKVSIRCGRIEARIAYELLRKQLKNQQTHELRINPVAKLYNSDGRLLDSNPLWRTIEPEIYAYAASMSEKAGKIDVYKIKLSEDPSDIPCCLYPDMPVKK